MFIEPETQFITMAWNNLSLDNNNVADNTLLYLSELDGSSFLLWPTKRTSVEYLRETGRSLSSYSSCSWSPENMNTFMVSSESEIFIKSSTPVVTTLFSVSSVFSNPVGIGNYLMHPILLTFHKSLLLF